MVPDAKPVPEHELKMLLEDEDPKVEKSESRGAEALEKLQQIDDEAHSPKEVEMAPMLPIAPLILQQKPDRETDGRISRGMFYDCNALLVIHTAFLIPNFYYRTQCQEDFNNAR